MRDIRFSMLAEEFAALKERLKEADGSEDRASILAEMRWLINEADEARRGHVAEMVQAAAESKNPQNKFPRVEPSRRMLN